MGTRIARLHPAGSVFAVASSNADVIGRQCLQGGQTPTGKILWPHKNGTNLNDPAIRQHERSWRGHLEFFIRALDVELPPKLSCPSSGIAHHVAVIERTGGNEKPKRAIRRFEHKMTMTTTPQFADRVLKMLWVKLTDRNAVTAVQEIGERVIGEAL
ncbi:MAG: hypothetical protein ABFD89_09425 [Bryobacteraceae bacterium]